MGYKITSTGKNLFFLSARKRREIEERRKPPRFLVPPGLHQAEMAILGLFREVTTQDP